MPLPISAIGTGLIPPAIEGPGAARSPGGFQKALEAAIGEVERSRRAASESIEQFLSGDADELHGAVLAAQRAELEFDLFLQVRNKVVQAYQEIMRMQM
jgi:flagellar hook-basal body complex protein FliE